jgi:predicted ribosome quality control (RQC) complex YloA/Tae2 family protein
MQSRKKYLETRELGRARATADGVDVGSRMAQIRRKDRFVKSLMGSKGRPYRTVLVDGFEVLIGRGDADNDYLTFEVAEPHELWFHVAGGTPGSHVVIKNPERREVPQHVVEAAAALAAWYSKARGSPRVDVHYCAARDVRKPRGAPAGLVELKRYESVRVVPSDASVPR